MLPKTLLAQSTQFIKKKLYFIVGYEKGRQRNKTKINQCQSKSSAFFWNKPGNPKYAFFNVYLGILFTLLNSEVLWKYSGNIRKCYIIYVWHMMSFFFVVIYFITILFLFLFYNLLFLLKSESYNTCYLNDANNSKIFFIEMVHLIH